MTKETGVHPARADALSGDKAKLLDLLLQQKAAAVQAIRPCPRIQGPEAVRTATSWAQQRLWFIDQLGEGGAAYNIPVALRLHGDLDLTALHRALDRIVQRHEALRTVFVSVKGDPKQEIVATGRFHLRQVDLSNMPPTQLEACVLEHKTEEAGERFDLRTGPLIRGRLICTGAEDHLLLITMHHIVSDGWSLGVLLRELSELYSTFHAGHADPLHPLPIQYADYAHWQRRRLFGTFMERQLAYWKSHLQGAPPALELPTDRARPVVQGYRGQTAKVALDPRLTAELRSFAQRHGMTPFMMLYAAWAVLLSKLSGQDDIVIGTPVANRRRAELEGLIGFFVNTLALRVSVADDAPVSAFLEQVKNVTLGAYDHQDVPFEQIVEALKPQRSLNRHPIFQAMLVLQNTPECSLDFSGLSVTQDDIVLETSKFDVLLFLEQQGSRLVGVVNYDTDLFDRPTIERWIESFTKLLEGIVHGDANRIGDLTILSVGTRRQVVEAFNATRSPYSHGKLIHELFEEQVRIAPETAAVVHAERTISYGALNSQANRLARHLRSKGIGPDELVGICCERSVEMVVALLAILKAGAAYMPLDPNYPGERLDYMLSDAAPRVVLTQQSLIESLPKSRAETVCLDTLLEEISHLPDHNVMPAAIGLASTNLLYVIYTSGSTGLPKGTAMAHRAMVNLIEWSRETFASGQRVLQFAALSFDVAFQEVFSTLCTGCTLVLLDEATRRDARALLGLLGQQRVERLFVPPLMLQSLAEFFPAANIALPALKDVVTAGEQLRITSQIVELFQNLRHCRLHNHYGPTETHVVTALTLKGDPAQWFTLPTIGQPIANTQIYILDEQRRPVAIGVSAEIYIGGANLARGYLHRPDLTSLRFVADPFSSQPHARLYKTGDLGRWRADGSIEYLGRNDDQVKIRGYRIELGEIEAQLAKHFKVREAAVIVREDSPGDKRLVAYVTPRDQSPGIEELRAHLQGALPDHMVPRAFVVLDTFPVTPSGKLNRRALPPPDAEAFATIQFEPPQGAVELAIAGIWRDLLGAERIGRQDSFFNLGGHSLLVLKALFQIEQALGCSLAVTDVYKSPTVQELAARIRHGAVAEQFVNLAIEATLDQQIQPLPEAPQTPAKAVLLTGATGFVGRFLLAQLLEDTNATIYCAIRAPSQSQAASKLRRTLMHWDLWRKDYEARIVAVAGDLRLPRLGIDEGVYDTLVQRVDAIYHCGSSMNHLETYSMAKLANVEATRELLRFATTQRPKQFNYISTLGVFAAPASGPTRVVRETDSIDQEQHPASGGYVASKWVAEKLLLTASERGIPCNLFRIGLVWADTQQGRYDELQRGYRIIKSCLLSGYGIENYRYEMPPTPADYVARAIVHLAGTHPVGQGVFHISAPTQMNEGVFERCNEALGTELELLPMYEWIGRLKQLHQKGHSLPAVPLIEYAFAMDEASFNRFQQRIQNPNIRFDCSQTQYQLERAGIHAPVLDDALLGTCVQSMLNRDNDLQEWRGSVDSTLPDLRARGRDARSNAI